MRSALITADLLFAHGVKYIIQSPGSRNTPLVMAVERHGGFKIYSIIDERSAAFVALGLAERTGEPVALVCTSGTAVLNYAPAVAEAYYRNLPLIVISADRPSFWIDQSDGQTIRQSNVLENIVKGSYDIPSDPNIRDIDWYVNRIVNSALIKATYGLKGPVHLNIHFDNPLNAEIADSQIRQRIVNMVAPPTIMNLAAIRESVSQCLEGISYPKIALVLGTSLPDARLNKALKRLSNCPQLIIFHEAQSGINGISKCITAIDGVFATLSNEEKKKLYPDLIITLGGDIVSKALKEWLRNAPTSMQHWYLGKNRNEELIDCFQHLTQCIDVDIPSFLGTLSHILQKSYHSNYKEAWVKIKDIFENKLSEFMNDCAWCDLTASSIIFNKLSSSVNLQISNGMSIRYAQLFCHNRFHRIDSNRGCNGIDGSTSTAIGASIDCPIPTVLLSGDMSFLYDIGALNLQCIPSSFRIFVINNKGGDIFRNIATTRGLPELETRFTLGRDRNFKDIARSFNFDYYYTEDGTSLTNAIRIANQPSEKPIIIEIDTSSLNNSQIYRNLIEYLKP